ncbi:MAG: hypothetical protein AB7V32_07600 [Candidatus Berkiella sp.]
MAQVHPFTNPFFRSATFDSNHSNDAQFNPYGNFFNFHGQSPWENSAKMSQDWFELSQQCWQAFSELATWQQQTLHQNMLDSAQVMMHCMQLSTNPTHLYRYIRRNWQKPYMTLGAQSLTAAKLLTKLMTNNMCTWQNAFHKHQSH